MDWVCEERDICCYCCVERSAILNIEKCLLLGVGLVGRMLCGV